MDLENTISKIIQNQLFLKLKDVVENNSYHDHEAVYDHLIKTKDIAKREILADFITNQEAKKLFQQFINEDFHGMKRADILILIALLHDIGKILYVKEGKTHSLLVTDSLGFTLCPGHEYQGSKIVNRILKDLSLSPQIINYIATIIRLHDTYNDGYMGIRKEWSLENLINDVKSRAEGFHKEALFNIYCDCFTAPPFQFAKEMIIKIFNSPSFYTENEYFIP